MFSGRRERKSCMEKEYQTGRGVQKVSRSISSRGKNPKKEEETKNLLGVYVVERKLARTFGKGCSTFTSPTR